MARKFRGFTLVELIVVIAVIGILAAIVLVGLNKYQADTRDARRLSSVTTISEALEKYYDQNGEYPSCAAVTAAAGTVVNSTLVGLTASALVAPQASGGSTNSISCGATLTTNGTDFFEYDGDGSAACNGSVACLSYTIKYKSEATNSVKSVISRRNTSIATSGASTVSIASTGFDNVGLTWTDVQNASSWTVEYGTSAGFGVGTFTDVPINTIATSYTVTGLTGGTAYYFRVRPSATDTSASWSNTATTTTLQLAQPVATATANSNSQITASWGAVPPSGTTYNVDYSTSSTFSSGVTSFTGISTTNKVVTGLSTGVQYFFRVKAINGAFQSAWSATVSATTFVPSPATMTAVDNSSTQITASWGSVGVATSYNLEYDTDSSFGSSTTITGLGTTSRAVTGLTQGQTYYFRAYALVGATASAPSTSASASTTIDTPGAPGIGAYTPGTVRPYSAGWWIAWINSPASGNWYYSYGQITSASCPAGAYGQYQFNTQYSSPTTTYGTGWSTASTWYMARPYSPYKIKFWAYMECVGPAGITSAPSGYNQACASNTGSNVACF